MLLSSRDFLNICCRQLSWLASVCVLSVLCVIILSIGYLSLNILKSYKLQVPIILNEEVKLSQVVSDPNFYQQVLDQHIFIVAQEISISSQALSSCIGVESIFTLQEAVKSTVIELLGLRWESLSEELEIRLGQIPELQQYLPLKIVVPVHFTMVDLHLYQQLMVRGDLEYSWNTNIFTHTNSGYVHLAGLKGAVVGTILVLFLTMLFAVPIGVLTGIYITNFCPPYYGLKGLIETLIFNLASIPSIIFGLVGLALFIKTLHIPRASVLVCSLVLAMLVLPIIIITTNNALKNVPKSIYQASLVLGATKMQTVFYQILPIAMPEIIAGIMTAFLRAFSETAPLILIGTMAFIADTPQSIFDPTTTLSIQIYQWIVFPRKEFIYLASFALVMIIFVISLCNILVNYYVSQQRKKYEKL